MSRASQAMLDALCLLVLPLALVACVLLQIQATALLTLVVATGAIALFFMGWERSKPHLRQVLPTAVLVSAAVVGRIIFAVAPNIQPVTAICIIAGAVFGKRSGFMTGAMSGLVSSLFLGLGVWTPWQMYAWGLVGYVAGLVFDRKGGCESIPAVLIFGFCASFVFGLIMNTWALVGFTNSVNWGSAAVVYGAGFVFDAAHAVSTVAFLALLFVPLRKRLGRVVLRYSLADEKDAKVQA